MTAVLAGFGVVVKQQMPDYMINMFVANVRGKYLPSILIMYAALISLWHASINEVLLALFGTYTSWCYLRFFQRKQDGSVGDSATTFELASFFPPFLRYYVIYLY